MEEVILFILLDNEEYTSDHALVYVEEIPNSILDKIENGVEGNEGYLPLTTYEYSWLEENGGIDFPATIINSFYVAIG